MKVAICVVVLMFAGCRCVSIRVEPGDSVRPFVSSVSIDVSGEVLR